MRNANHITNQKIALMQLRQAALLYYLQILMSKRRVWETRPTTYSTSGIRRTCAYDPVGNRLTKVPDAAPSVNETTQYSYDDENRLAGVEITKQDGSGMRRTYAFAYDPFGKRITKTLIKDEIGTACTSPNVCPRTTKYFYDGQNIILEYQNSNITAKYTHGPSIDEPLAVQHGANTSYYYHADGLGSITAMTNTSGTVVQTYSYDSFGNITASGSISQPYAFTGREYDSETGMYFYRARYYDPKVGRFVTKDPLGFGGGDINLYNYVGANPVNWGDPEGMELRIYSRQAGFPISAITFGQGNHAFLCSTVTQSCWGTSGSSGSGAQADKWKDIPANTPYNVVSNPRNISETDVMNYMNSTRNSGLYFPRIHDCHSAVDRTLSHFSLENPGAPGGRVGRRPNCGGRACNNSQRSENCEN